MINQGYILILMFYSLVVFGYGSSFTDSNNGFVPKWKRFLSIILLTSTLITSFSLVLDGLFYLFNGGWVDPFAETDFSGCRGRSCILILPLKLLFSSYPWLIPIVFGLISFVSFLNTADSVLVLINKDKK
tara:strand:- start:736 stop:1125 length:390 start_codon:yes stop_codon:yes gene_type:complete